MLSKSKNKQKSSSFYQILCQYPMNILWRQKCVSKEQINEIADKARMKTDSQPIPEKLGEYVKPENHINMAENI